MSSDSANFRIFDSHTEASIKEFPGHHLHMKKLSIVDKGHPAEEPVVGFHDVGDRMKVWVRFGGFWGLLFGCLLMLLGCVRPESVSPEMSSSAHASAQPATLRSARSAAGDNQTSEERLQGTWLAEDVDVSTGEAKIKLTFREEDRMKIAAWSDIPFVGQVRDKKASYEVHGNVISSKAIRGGTSVEFWFEDEELIIKYKDGKSVRFHRE